jgi:glycine/sarcosine N-methyltransferase
MIMDAYEGFAERYDWMHQDNSARRDFFRQLFINNQTTKILDCACGTGRDLLMFHDLGLTVFGSDLSDSMLIQARKNIGDSDIPTKKVNFCELAENYNVKFDAVACLTNSINEPLEDLETLQAMRSMKAVLSDGGILVFDQGQTDASMQNPPPFAPILNNRDITRFFTMEYSANIQTVNIFDFIHTEDNSDFRYTSVRIRVRLMDNWLEILREVGFNDVKIFGGWDLEPYDKQTSSRLIVVAKN